MLDDWNLGEKSGRWQTQRVLEKLQFIYGVDAFFTINIVADERTDNTNVIQVCTSVIEMTFIYYLFEYGDVV